MTTRPSVGRTQDAVVFTEFGRSSFNRSALSVVHGRRLHHAGGAETVDLNLCKQPPVGEMIILIELCKRHDRRHTDSALLGFMVEVHDVPVPNKGLEVRIQQLYILSSCARCLKPLIGCPLGIAHELDQSLPLILFNANKKDLSVFGFKKRQGFKPRGLSRLISTPLYENAQTPNSRTPAT